MSTAPHPRPDRTPDPAAGRSPDRPPTGLHRFDPLRSALILDAVALVAFVLVGRRSHGEGSVLLGVLGTLWPFAVGAAAGWLGVLALRRRSGLCPASVRAGLLVAAGAAGVGMVLRAVSGGRTPLSFVIAGSIFLTLFVVGWRLLVLAAETVARRRAAPGRA